AWSVIPQALVRKERWPGGYKIAEVPMPLVSPGQDVVPDQPLLRWQVTSKAFAVRPTSQSLSRQVSSSSTAHVGANAVEEVVAAGLRGRVVEITNRGGVVIESRAILVQGVVGAGDQVAGILTLWPSDNSDRRQTIPPGALLVVPGPLNFA